MESFTELALVLKSYPYQDRDKIVVCLTENRGRLTGLAKGGVHSRRYGGSLDSMACSRIRFVQKPNAEMARIEEAVTHHEFSRLPLDFERLTAASFAAEFCMKLLEPNAPSREMFLVLSNMLYQLDAGIDLKLAINAFLCKAFKAMGYPPSLLRCVQCSRGAHQIIENYGIDREGLFYWYSEAGGMICHECGNGRFKVELEGETLLYFHKLTMTIFKDLAAEETSVNANAGASSTTRLNDQLYRLLADFLHHHIPGMPAAGLKSWRLLNDALVGP